MGSVTVPAARPDQVAVALVRLTWARWSARRSP